MTVEIDSAVYALLAQSALLLTSYITNNDNISGKSAHKRLDLISYKKVENAKFIKHRPVLFLPLK